MQIRRVEPNEAEAYAALRKRSLVESPMAFLSSPEDDHASDVEFQREALSKTTTQAGLGAFTDDGELVGMAVVVRAPQKKRQHVAEIFGMYVAPEARGMGAGKALLAAAIERARRWDGVVKVMLSVTSTQPAAMAMYQKAGFEPWGLERRAILWEGQLADEHHLSLDLR